MSFLDRLRALRDALPSQGSVTFTRADLDALLSEGESGTAVPADPLADFTVERLAVELGRSPSTVRGWRLAGEFPNAYQLGREWRIPKSDVRAYFARQPRATTPAAESTAPPHKGSDDLASWRTVRKPEAA
jgi:excisionase family DNA binding protein